MAIGPPKTKPPDDEDEANIVARQVYVYHRTWFRSWKKSKRKTSSAATYYSKTNRLRFASRQIYFSFRLIFGKRRVDPVDGCCWRGTRKRKKAILFSRLDSCVCVCVCVISDISFCRIIFIMRAPVFFFVRFVSGQRMIAPGRKCGRLVARHGRNYNFGTEGHSFWRGGDAMQGI